MFGWLKNRRSTKRQALDLLAQTAAQLQQSQALCKRWVALFENQTTQLTAAQSENARLWTAFSAPTELQPYIAAGASEAEARELASAAPRGA